jgi:hypothetical protein
MLLPSPHSENGLVTLHYRSYIGALSSEPNKLGLGVRTVVVYSPQVGQKSYANEKRFVSFVCIRSEGCLSLRTHSLSSFLCPPPAALLLGASWWTRPSLAEHATAPSVSVSIGKEASAAKLPVDWITWSGNARPPCSDTLDPVIAGRIVGKQLVISSVNEQTKAAEALVLVSASDCPIGRFPSAPIKVISKPSKRRAANSKNPAREHPSLFVCPLASG